MKKIFGVLLGVLLIIGTAAPVQAAEEERSVKEYLKSMLENVEETGILSSDMEEAIHNYIDKEDVIPDNIEQKQVKEVIGYIKEKLEITDLNDTKEVSEAIAEAEEEFQITLSETEKQTILNVIEKINELGLDPQDVLTQAEKLFDKYGSQITEKAQETYEEYGSEIVEQAQETVKENVRKSIGDYFSEMAARVKNFFTGFFA